jgi:hypothetical protein
MEMTAGLQRGRAHSRDLYKVAKCARKTGKWEENRIYKENISRTNKYKKLSRQRRQREKKAINFKIENAEFNGAVSHNNLYPMTICIPYQAVSHDNLYTITSCNHNKLYPIKAVSHNKLSHNKLYPTTSCIPQQSVSHNNLYPTTSCIQYQAVHHNKLRTIKNRCKTLIHSFSSLSKAPSTASSPHSAIYSTLLQM